MVCEPAEVLGDVPARAGRAAFDENEATFHPSDAAFHPDDATFDRKQSMLHP